jgi:hypothetical protein
MRRSIPPLGRAAVTLRRCIEVGVEGLGRVGYLQLIQFSFVLHLRRSTHSSWRNDFFPARTATRRICDKRWLPMGKGLKGWRGGAVWSRAQELGCRRAVVRGRVYIASTAWAVGQRQRSATGHVGSGGRQLQAMRRLACVRRWRRAAQCSAHHY